MTEEEFQYIVSQESALAAPLERAAAAMPRRQFGGVAEAAAVVLLFPIARFLLVEIGLPWLYETKRYSELWRSKFHRWIDQQYQGHGLDPDQAEAAGEQLRKELEQMTDARTRTAWERLTHLLTQASGDEDAPGDA